jgi:hypothetical protein
MNIMKKGETRIISASTILILSGFLIGLTVGKIVSESLSPYVLSCGLAGFLAFIALEFTGTQREEKIDHDEKVHVQTRLDRHVMSLSSMSFRMPDEADSLPAGPLDPADLSGSTPDMKLLDDLYDQLMQLNTESDSAELEAKQPIQA